MANSSQSFTTTNEYLEPTESNNFEGLILTEAINADIFGGDLN